MATSTSSEIKLPADAIEADAKLRESAARVKAMVKEKQEAEGDKPKAKKAPAKRKTAAKKATPKKTAAKKAAPTKRRRRKAKRAHRHDGRDIVYPKTAEEGKAHADAVRAEKERVTQCPPAKAAGIKTTADVTNPKTEVKMRKKTRSSATKVTATKTRRKPTTRKTTARKTTARKTTARKAAPKTTRSRANGKDLEMKIKVLVDKCPRKAGTIAAKRWAKLKAAKNVGDFLAKTKKAGLGNCRGFITTEVDAGRAKLVK